MTNKARLFMFAVIISAILISQLEQKWANIILTTILIVLLGILAYLKLSRNKEDR